MIRTECWTKRNALNSSGSSRSMWSLRGRRITRKTISINFLKSLTKTKTASSRKMKWRTSSNRHSESLRPTKPESMPNSKNRITNPSQSTWVTTTSSSRKTSTRSGNSSTMTKTGRSTKQSARTFSVNSKCTYHPRELKIIRNTNLNNCFTSMMKMQMASLKSQKWAISSSRPSGISLQAESTHHSSLKCGDQMRQKWKWLNWINCMEWWKL